MSLDSVVTNYNYWQNDPLLQCLVILTKLYNNPFSAESLRAGLPLQNFTPELFIRASERADLTTELNKQVKLAKLKLPAVLLLKDNQACVLIEYSNQISKIILPSNSEKTVEISNRDLIANYTGNALLSQPIYKLDSRSEDTSTKPVNWFWGTLAKSWPIYTEVMVASALTNLFALASPLFVMNVYDRVVPNHAIETLWVLAIGVAIVFGFDLIIRTIRGYFIDIAGKKTDIKLASMIFEQVLGTQRASHPNSVGAFANHLHEFESFRDFFTSTTLATLIDIPFALLFIAIIWTLHSELAQIPLYIMPIIIIFSILIQFPLYKVIKQTFRASTQKHAMLVEILTAMETIKTTGAESQMQKNWEQLILEISQSSLKSRLLSAISVNFSLFIQQMATVIVVVYGVYLIVEGELTMGALIACSILTSRALAPMTQIASLLTRYHHSVAALQALNQIMQTPVERPVKRQFLNRPKLQGNIEFNQVTFSYQDIPAINKVSFKIAAGQKIGIIGRIGSGKSTLAKLILKLYQPDNGKILLDGIDSQQIDPAELRRQIGYVPQEVELFYGNVKDNIVMGATHVEDKIMLQAAELAGVTEFTNQHPLGFDMPVGERGVGLSGGQRQMIGLARALLLEPQILLFDEPTNAMDNNAEEMFKNRLNLTDKTLLLVTHRTSLLSLVDSLIVMDAGQIVAIGPKDKVIQALASKQVTRK
ncbi:type I secretion system permease/ATPase [Candidatus Halobeggiatoa sp. HSG11]|nr:type I secretion system permease/ATPase [Candidatus Halobeggiatoa sp. HSG11]